jgi:hypothetical protein
MNKLIIKEDLANKVLNYLASRPYIEVHTLIHEMQNTLENLPAPTPIPTELKAVEDLPENDMV